MIGVPLKYAPPTLLCDDMLPAIAQDLLKRSRAARENRKWLQAIRCAADALQFSQESGDVVGSALSQIHLADFYCDIGELGHAMRYALNAYQILHHQADVLHRHNEAMATYALGLLEGMHLVRIGRSLRWYQESLRQLEAAREYWTKHNDTKQVDLVSQMRSRIEATSDETVQSRASLPPWRASFVIWPVDSADVPFKGKGELRSYLIDAEYVLIKNTYYRSHPAIGLDERQYHFGLPVPEDEWAVPAAQAGDYVLIRQQWKVDKEGVGVVWEPGRGWLPGEFKFATPWDMVYRPPAPHIIGGGAGGGDLTNKLKGYVVALLKPER